MQEDNSKGLQWAAALLAREINNNLYGSVTFKMEKGKITSAKTEIMEKPTLNLTEN